MDYKPKNIQHQPRRKKKKKNFSPHGSFLRVLLKYKLIEIYFLLQINYFFDILYCSNILLSKINIKK